MEDPRQNVLAICAFIILAVVMVWAAAGAFGAGEARG